MMIIKLIATLEYDGNMMHGDDEQAREWFFNDILGQDKLEVYSPEIGDMIGKLRIIMKLGEDDDN